MITVELISQHISSVPGFQVQLAEFNVLFYIAGCTAYDLPVKVCSDCQGKLTDKLLSAQYEQFLILKQYTLLKGGLTMPSTQWFHVIKKLEKTFTNNREYILHMDKVQEN